MESSKAKRALAILESLVECAVPTALVLFPFFVYLDVRPNPTWHSKCTEHVHLINKWSCSDPPCWFWRDSMVQRQEIRVGDWSAVYRTSEARIERVFEGCGAVFALVSAYGGGGHYFLFKVHADGELIPLYQLDELDEKWNIEFECRLVEPNWLELKFTYESDWVDCEPTYESFTKRAFMRGCLRRYASPLEAGGIPIEPEFKVPAY